MTRDRLDVPDAPPVTMDDDAPVIPPPSDFTVTHHRIPILYLPDGRVLVRRPAGFRTTD